MEIPILSGIISFGDGLDVFAHDNNIKLSLIIFLLIIELLWSIFWMMIVRRGVTMGLGIWFMGTFILVFIICAYAIGSVMYTKAAATGSSVWLFDKISGVTG